MTGARVALKRSTRRARTQFEPAGVEIDYSVLIDVTAILGPEEAALVAAAIADAVADANRHNG
jgi:hypothetical protein